MIRLASDLGYIIFIIPSSSRVVFVAMEKEKDFEWK